MKGHTLTEPIKLGRVAANAVRELALHSRRNVEDAHDIGIALTQGDHARVLQLTSDIAIRSTHLAFIATFVSAGDMVQADAEIMELNRREKAKGKTP